MQFEYPILLWTLALIIPGLILFFWWAWRTKRRLIAQFVQSRLLATLTVGVSTARQKARMALLVAGVGLILLCLARPQWGFSWEEAKQRGLDIVVAIDTSKSMLADDVPPNRLARARLAAVDLRRLARMDRMGLVAFSGTAFLQCPLSIDDEAFRQSVNALDVGIIPQGGTALAEAIDTALKAFKENNDNHKILVLFTDGEDHDGRALEAAKAAAKDGLKIFPVGIGTPNGEMLRSTDARGRTDFIRDAQGNAVKSRLNESLLREVGEATDGFYLMLSGANTMDLLYERGLAPLPKGEFSSRQVRRFHERYQWFLGLAIALLLAEMFLPERRAIRRTEAILTATNPELRRAVAFLVALLVPMALVASPKGALRQYQAGNYERAFREYQRSLEEKPGNPQLQFNTGSSAYQAARYDDAVTHLEAALDSPGIATDLPLQARALSNLGSARYRLGEAQEDPSKRIGEWEQAVKRYEQSLQLDPEDQDTRFNHEWVKKRLEELKQSQDQKKQDQSGDDKDESKQDEGEDQKKDQEKGEQPKDQSPSDQDQQNEQKQKQPQPGPEDDQKKEDSSSPGEKGEKEEQKSPPQKQNEADQGEKPDQPGEEGQPQAGMVARMTPQQAMQLLDAQKGDEQAMVFTPRIRTNRQDRLFKDW